MPDNPYNSPACLLHAIDTASVVIYHNPRCSKSRATLELIRSSGIEPHIVEYLSAPPSAAELRAIVDKLGIQPADLIRRGEPIFIERYADQTLSDADWIDAMVQHPILIERPIVVRGDRAVIGRPPANARPLLEMV